MRELDLHYPQDACPFCAIATAYTAPTPSPLWSPRPSSLISCIPAEDQCDPAKTSISSFVVLAAHDVLAFLDILPMTGGHLLVASRGHNEKVEDLGAAEGCAIGKFYSRRN